MNQAETVTYSGSEWMLEKWHPPYKAEYRPGQRATLDDLSNETLTTIAAYVREPFIITYPDECGPEYYLGVRSLLHLALCSHRLHQITEPILYHEFRESDVRKQSTDKMLVSFMCAIISRPRLATRVKRFCGRARDCKHNEHPHMSDDDSLDMSGVTDEDWTSIEAAVKSVELNNGAISLTELKEGCWEALTALVLCLLPNIEDLKFKSWGLCDYASLEAVVSSSTESLKYSDRPWKAKPLSLLRHYSLAYWDTEFALGLDTPFPLLKLKTLRSITMFQTASGDGFEDPDDDGTIEYERTDVEAFGESESFNSSNFDHITSVSLHNSAVDHESMKAFLLLFPKLESLIYDHGGATTGEALFEPPKLMRAFLHLRHCLQRLEIFDYAGMAGITFLELYPIGSFASFSRLKHIATSAPILLGNVSTSHKASDYGHTQPLIPSSQTLIDSLPDSLESLVLNDCRERDVPLLFEFVSHASKFKSFKYLDLGWEGYLDEASSRNLYGYPGFTHHQAIEFLNLCEAVGWCIKIENLAPPAKTLYGWIRNRDLGEKEVGVSVNAELSKPIYETLNFSYPYTQWEEYCDKFDCDPATGKRLDQ